MIRCAVLGATGYTGIELVRILLRHPMVKLAHLTTRQEKPIRIQELIPSLPSNVSLEVRQYDFNRVKKDADVIFICLPHTEAMKAGREFFKAGKIVIDLSADYRLKKVKAYETWYGVKHLYPELLRQAIYGLPELYRKEIREANLIANPGCYPTSVALALLPLLKNKLIQPAGIIVDSKSGVTGAGKKLTAQTQYAELDENFYAYKVNRHQHTPEILQTLESVSKSRVSMTFVPHLLPIQRGILSVHYVQLRTGVKASAVAKAFKDFYQGEPFIRLKAQDQFPALKDVQQTNYCDIGWTVDMKKKQVIVISAIDNLLKGASGQAVQNMNIRCGFPEEEGLKLW